MSSIQSKASPLDVLSPASSGEDHHITSSSAAGKQRDTSDAADTEQLSGFSTVCLDAVKDARSIVRLMQCQLCDKILQNPTTLPCGYSICRSCLPKTRPRPNVTWPGLPGRHLGFDCPVPECGKDHAAVDCAPDITLNKVLDSMKAAITRFAEVYFSKELAECSTRISVRGLCSSEEEKQPEPMMLDGGRILTIYSLVELGKLAYRSEVLYSPDGVNTNQANECDAEIFSKLKEAAKAEMDCQICFALFLDPVTTPCGHTYCRSCVRMIRNHSDLCPICRRAGIRIQVSPRVTPSNGRLVSMIDGFLADLVALPQQADDVKLDIPLFAFMVSFPLMPTRIVVYEPPYHLMIERIKDRGLIFGMVLKRQSPEPDDPPFMEFGVLLRIETSRLIADGEGVIKAVGLSRFKVTHYEPLDGYFIANIETVDDISLADEEALEASKVGSGSRPTASEVRVSTSGSTDVDSPSVTEPTPDAILARRPESMSTREIADFNFSYIQRIRERADPSHVSKIVELYGECPEDPIILPWWFGSVFRLNDAVKYKLLDTLSVRERVKICYRLMVDWETASRVSFYLYS